MRQDVVVLEMLSLSLMIWDADTAWFRMHNPTDRDITSDFATARRSKASSA